MALGKGGPIRLSNTAISIVAGIGIQCCNAAAASAWSFLLSLHSSLTFSGGPAAPPRQSFPPRPTTHHPSNNQNRTSQPKTENRKTVNREPRTETEKLLVFFFGGGWLGPLRRGSSCQT